MKKHFSIRRKLLVIFGLLIIATGTILSTLAIRIIKKAVVEKIEVHLIDRAGDTAEILDGRISAFFQFLEGIVRMPDLLDTSVSHLEKNRLIKREVIFNKNLHDASIIDLNGNDYTSNGEIQSYASKDWFKSARKGQRFVSEPELSSVDNKLVITFALPIYGNNRDIIGVLRADILAEWFSKQTNDIVLGETGHCYIIGLVGDTVADRDIDSVMNRTNVIKDAKIDKSLVSVGTFEEKALTSKTGIGFYTYEGKHKIASYAKMKTTGWTVIINTTVNEIMGIITMLHFYIYVIGAITLIVTLIIVFITTGAIIKPITKIVSALQNIAQGEGDLTVRLPLHGNDEISDLSKYFNQTIEKISSSIKSVGNNADIMQDVGEELSSNMIETASAMNQISANIDGVKTQVLTQAASVSETTATVEEIIRTIKQLNTSIENQAASVEESSSAIEQMVGNIASITQTLGKTDEVIKDLTGATDAGRETILASNEVTKRIAEESGGLMEASSVIQHIASQTNLLAMNAAIEAAHAGEAGKGFAVVADEIRKLAEESSMQGKTITATLKNLGCEIEELSSASKTAEDKFNMIFSLSEQVKDMSTRLMEAMKEQEHGSKEVLEAIRDINSVTAQVKDGSAEMLTGGENVADEMRKLDDLTRVITDSMNEMASGTIQINNAMEEVGVIVQKNKNSIYNLSAEVSKFKTGNERHQRTHKKAEIGIDLSTIINRHVEWKVKLRTAISNHEHLDAEVIADDSMCPFGKWLYGTAGDKYKHLASYEQCLKKHAAFHKEAGKVAATVNEGKFAEAGNMLGSTSSFSMISREVTSSIKALKAELGV